MPALLSSLIAVSESQPGEPIATGPRACQGIAMWLDKVPDHRSHLGRWHSLSAILGVGVYAMTAAGNDSPTAITEWAADCPTEILAALGVRRDPFIGRYRPPSTRTICRVLAHVDAQALDAAVCGYLAARAATADLSDLEDLGEQEIIRGEREQRRAASRRREQQEHPRDPGEPALLPGYAGDGKVVRGAVRPDGTKVNLLAVMSHKHGTVVAQREIPAKTNEIPELAGTIEYLDLVGAVFTLDALHTQVATAHHLTDTKKRTI